MKYYMFLPLILAAFFAKGTNYYVSNHGNNSNAGTSEGAPWKTIEKVNSQSFKSGDSILFERGGAFFGTLTPESGSASGHIVYGAYGSGTKPIIHHSVLLDKQNDWVDMGNNIWQTSGNQVIDSDVGNISFNSEESSGIKCPSLNELDSQGKFWYGHSNGKLHLYSIQNPASYYNSIRCLFGPALILQNNESYITYQGLWLSYCGGFGIAGGNVDNIVIKDCDFSYLGGYYPNEGTTIRVGNAVEFWARAENCLVEGCKIWEIYDAALTNQSTATGNQTNITYRYNIIWNCEYSFEIWHRGPNSIVNNIQFINNTCMDAGYGWGHNQRPDPSGRHISAFETSANMSQIIVKNNIFYNAKGYLVYFPDNDHDIHSTLEMDHNCLFQEDGQKLVEIEVNRMVHTFHANNIGEYPSKTGFGGNSIFTDPQLSGFGLSPTSACIDAGDPSFPADPDNTPPDMGAIYYHQWPSSVDLGAGKHFNYKLFPNPANNRLNVQFDTIPSNMSIELMDVKGKVFETRKVISTLEQFNTESLAPGIYLIKIGGKQKFDVQKLLVK